MEISMLMELHMFFTTVYGGLITGFVYDIYRTIRYLSKPKKIMTYLGDLLFWTIAAIILFLTVIKINWGEIRGYILLGFFLGGLIYIKLFSPYIYPICVVVFQKTKNTVKFVLSIIFFPLNFFKSKLMHILKKIKKTIIILVKEAKKYKKIISSKK